MREGQSWKGNYRLVNSGCSLFYRWYSYTPSLMITNPSVITFNNMKFLDFRICIGAERCCGPFKNKGKEGFLEKLSLKKTPWGSCLRLTNNTSDYALQVLPYPSTENSFLVLRKPPTPHPFPFLFCKHFLIRRVPRPTMDIPSTAFCEHSTLFLIFPKNKKRSEDWLTNRS